MKGGKSGERSFRASRHDINGYHFLTRVQGGTVEVRKLSKEKLRKRGKTAVVSSWDVVWDHHPVRRVWSCYR